MVENLDDHITIDQLEKKITWSNVPNVKIE